jgi:transcriptional regulator with XRE-family HTH domain
LPKHARTLSFVGWIVTPKIVRAPLPGPVERQRVRIAALLSVPEAADQLDVDVQALYRWEAGRSEPTGARRTAYAAWLASTATRTAAEDAQRLAETRRRRS